MLYIACMSRYTYALYGQMSEVLEAVMDDSNLKAGPFQRRVCFLGSSCLNQLSTYWIACQNCHFCGLPTPPHLIMLHQPPSEHQIHELRIYPLKGKASLVLPLIQFAGYGQEH